MSECVHHDHTIVEDYISNLQWSSATTDNEKALVVSNIRGFYAHTLTYTAPPRVVDEALAEKVCILYYNEPAWKFMSHKKECIGNMHAALKAALEQTK